MPLVSVLVPVYNVQAYLSECLDSLVGQTLKNIEIVCVDDGSTDDSLRILQEYAANDERIRIVRKENGGLPSARNAGLAVARGKYVGFVDSDDYVSPDMFRRLYAVASSSRADMVVCGAHCVPDEKGASNWMKDVLSPRNITYTASTVKTFYDERAAHPFLWRTLVDRDFIESHGLRLDESVILGEDVAFLYKLYTCAKRITFLSDKLYYYRWKRPDSIMEGLNYKDPSLKLCRHIKMVRSMWQSAPQTEEDRSVQFHEWALDFLYWDIIKLPMYRRIEVAKECAALLKEISFYRYYESYNDKTKEFARYIESLTCKSAVRPKISVVIVLNGCKDYLQHYLNSVYAQTCKDFEIIFFENGADGDTAKIMWNNFFSTDVVSVRSGEWRPLCYSYNEAVVSASGDYILFANGFDLITDRRFFEKAIAAFESDAKVQLVGQTEGHERGKVSIADCEPSCYRNFFFRTDTIRKERLVFSDYSFLTGSVFFTEYCLRVKSAYALRDVIRHNIPLRREKIYAEEAKYLLRAFVRLLETANAEKLPKLGRRLAEMLNSENYVRLLTDSTYGFYVNASSVENPQEDFHREVLELLLRCNRMCALSDGEAAVLRPLYAFIEKRHSFLSWLQR